jgi:AcrR family transcriptional regulator
MNWQKFPSMENRHHFPVGRPTADQAAKRTEHLIDAAWEVFVEMGYEGSSIAEIARRAGASKQTLYSRFATKAELFKAVIRRGTDILHESFSRILVPGEAVEKVLQDYGENLAQLILQPEAQQFFRTVIGAANSFPEMAEFFWEHGSQEGKKMLAAYLAMQNDKGVLVIKDPMRAAHMFDSLCTGPAPIMATMGLLIPCDTQEIHRHVSEAVRIFLAAYAAPQSS